MNSGRCNLRMPTPKRLAAPEGPDKPKVNPCRVEDSRPVRSVGCTYGYSWNGPSRGRIHSIFHGLNSHVAHPQWMPRSLLPVARSKSSSSRRRANAHVQPVAPYGSWRDSAKMERARKVVRHYVQPATLTGPTTEPACIPHFQQEGTFR